MIICVVAKMGGGKGFVAKALGKELSLPVIEVSDIVKRISNASARKDLQLELNNHKDNPNWLYDEIKKEIDGDCLISGIREPFLLDQLEKDFGKENIKVTKVMISDKRRRERLVERDKKSLEEIIGEEKKDEGLGINETLERGQYSISSEGEYEDTANEIFTLCNKLRGKINNESIKGTSSTAVQTHDNRGRFSEN